MICEMYGLTDDLKSNHPSTGVCAVPPDREAEAGHDARFMVAQ
jgi:hypothetical protein